MSSKHASVKFAKILCFFFFPADIPVGIGNKVPTHLELKIS